MMRRLAFAAFGILLLVQTGIFAQEQMKESEKKEEKKPSWFDNVQIKGD
jgi:hypothetical protein